MDLGTALAEEIKLEWIRQEVLRDIEFALKVSTELGVSIDDLVDWAKR